MTAAALVTIPQDSAATSRPASRRLGAKAPDRGRRGRPRKFSRPSRAVTLTLPEDVIAALQAIDSDLSRAVVHATQAVAPQALRARVEITLRGEQTVIVVPFSPLLKSRTGVELVPLADGGALISLDERVSVQELELRIVDALADPTLAGADRQMFESLAEILRQARQAEGIVLNEQRILVVRQPASRRESVA